MVLVYASSIFNIPFYSEESLSDINIFIESIHKYKTVITQLDFDLISNEYAQFDFMFVNKWIRNSIAYNNIYKPIELINNILLMLDCDINEYEFDSQNNKEILQKRIINSILKLQNIIYKTHVQDNRIITIKQFSYNIAISIYNLLLFLYKKDLNNPKPDKKNFVYSIMTKTLK